MSEFTNLVKLLVTGSHGFVGHAAADCAAKQGWEVWGVGRSAQPPSDWQGGYSYADVAQSDLTPIINKFAPDIVFHGAGAASVGQSFEAPLDDLKASVLTFANMADAVRRSNHRPIIVLPSSAAVYGNPSRLPILETDKLQPISPYGFHKMQCEIMAQEYVKCFQLQIVIGRIFSVFGPRQKRLLVWELFQQYVSSKPQVQLQGTGDETRDYLHVDDVAELMLSLAECRLSSQDTELGIFNIASGTQTSVLEIANIIAQIVGTPKPILRAESSRAGDPVRWQADIASLHQAIPSHKTPVLAERMKDTFKVWLESH